MRYNRLRDLGLTEQQIQDNLMFTGVKVGELMKMAMDPKEAKEWFGAPPPDLTVIARARSLRSRQRRRLAVHLPARVLPRPHAADAAGTTWCIANVAMPHVLWQLSVKQWRAGIRSEDEAQAR